MARVSPLAVVDPKAVLADDVEVGPFCVIGPDVTVGPACRLVSSVTLMGPTRIGRNNIFYPNVVIGGPPQDRKYRGAPTRIEIGDDNMFREACTVHRGTEKGGAVTRVGNNNFLMVNTHVGHDAQVGSGCTFANNCMIAGHVHIHDCVNMAGGAGLNHFVTVGEYAFIGAYSRIHHDVPPFSKVDGPDLFRGVNVVGLSRSGLFSNEDIQAIEDACKRLFYHERPFSVAMAEFHTMNGLNPHVKRLLEFLRRRDMGRHGRYLESLRAK